MGIPRSVTRSVQFLSTGPTNPCARRVVRHGGSRSYEPRDMPVFARGSSNARISGMHDTVARRNANALDPCHLSAGWARRNHPPDARPDHGGCVSAIRTLEIDHFG